MAKVVYEYRILGKNGGECFRTRSYEDASQRLNSLKEKKPRVNFQMQSRHCNYDGFEYEQNWRGEYNWSIWL